MKKSTCIHLVLITAALASCDRPLYQQQADYYYQGDEPDSSNSCPMAQSDLPPDYYTWSAGFWPYDEYFGEPYGFNINLEGYYFYRYPATVIRAGFGKIGGGSGHS